MAKRYVPRWLRRLGWTVLSLFLIYTVIGFFALPLVVWHLVLPRVNEQIAGTIAIEGVYSNPFTWEFRLEKVTGCTPDGDLAMSLDKFLVNVNPWSVFGDEFVVQTLELDRPFLNLVVAEDGSVNIQSSLSQLREQAEKMQEEPEPVGPDNEPFVIPAVRIERLAVTDAGMRCEIRSFGRPVMREIRDVSFVMDNASTASSHDNPYHFTLKTERGESFTLDGSLRLDPLSTVGTVALDQLDLDDLLVFAGDKVGMEVARGRLDVSFRYVFRPLGDQSRLALEDGRVALNGFALAPKGEPDSPFQTIDALELAGLDVNLLQKSIHLDAVSLAGGSLDVVRENDGVLNLIRYIVPPEQRAALAATAKAEREGEASEREIRLGVVSADQDLGVALTSAWNQIQQLVALKWQLTVDAVDLSELRLTWRDEFLARPAELRLGAITLHATGLNNQESTPFPYTLELSVNESGHVALDGEFVAEPASSSFGYQVTTLPVAMIGPYLDGLVPLRLADGALSAGGKADIAFPDAATPELSAEGDISLASFRLDWAEPVAPFVQWDALAVSGLKANSEDLSATIGEVRLTAPRLWVERQADGSIRLPLPSAKAAEPSPADTASDEAGSSTPAAGAPTWRIDELVVAGGQINVHDASVSPAESFSLADANLSVRPVVLAAGQPVTAELSFRLADGPQGAVEVAGSLEPLSPLAATAATVSVNNVTLPSFAAYAVPLLGRAPEGGRLTATLGYAVDQGMLAGNNEIRIKNMRFGPRVEGSDAPNLPLDLGVAILEDREGVMQLDVPVEGDTNSPDFSLGQVIQYAIMNVFEKVLTAPFGMLGSLLPGGEGGDVNQVAFAPGQATLPADVTAALGKFAEVLLDRPALQLELTPSVDPVADAAALAAQSVENQVKARMAAEDDDEEDALEDLYDALPPERRAPDGVDETPAVMREYLEKAVTVTTTDFDQLASARVEAVRSAILTGSGLSPERVARKAAAEDADYAQDGAEVVFGLGALPGAL